MKQTGKVLPEAFKNMFEKPATVKYPANRKDVFTDVRGKLVFDAPKCVGCQMCVRDCPAKAIEIQKIGEKQFKAVLHVDRCIFCGQCVDSCNKDALHCTKEFELASLSRNDMAVDI